MPVIVVSLAKMLMSMGATLLTQGVLKQVIVLGLEKLVHKTKSDADDRLLEIIKREWGIN